VNRDNLYIDLYFSKELKSGAKYLLREFPNQENLWEDLLSDTIIEVFKKKDSELFELNSRNKLKAYIYFSMRNIIYKGVASKSFRNYGLNNEYTNYIEFENNQEDEEIETLPITKKEVIETEKLFGCVTKLNVQFMREIDKADNNKKNNYEDWESAQITKLYYEFKSFRKVSKATGIGFQQVRNQVIKFSNKLNTK
jgi:hypothetical protein